MFERLEAIKQRNEFITNELTKPEVISDVGLTTQLSKEQSGLTEIIECYDAYLKANGEIYNDHKIDQDGTYLTRPWIYEKMRKYQEINTEMGILDFNFSNYRAGKKIQEKYEKQNICKNERPQKVVYYAMKRE